MKISNSIKEILIAIGTGLLIITWIGLVIKFINPYLINFDLFGNQSFTPIGFFIFGCIVTPLWEEIYFRFIPFEIMKKVNRFTKEDFTGITLLLTSLIFAAAHTNGIYNIIYQGIGGFILGILYLKTKRSYMCTVIAHAIWNISAFYILPLIN